MPFHIGLLLFPDITQLDMTGPYEVFIKFPDAKVHLIWKRSSRDGGRRDADHADHDIRRMPAARSHLRAGRRGHERAAQRCRDARLHPPSGERRALCDQRVHRRAGARRGRALEGQARRDALDEPRDAEAFGATPVAERVVVDGNVITGGGVTAGIDFALTVAAEAFGPELAKAIQLGIEYDPHPPFDAGSPERADPALVAEDARRRGETPEPSGRPRLRSGGREACIDQPANRG